MFCYVAGKIPTELGGLERLEVIDLSENNLVGEKWARWLYIAQVE